MNYTTDTLTRDSIGNFVLEILVSMGVEANNITDESNLEDLGLDSLDVVDLIRAVRKQLMIQIAAADFEKVETIKQAVTVIADKAGIQ